MCVLVKDIAADFVLLKWRVPEYTAGRAGSILNSSPNSLFCLPCQETWKHFQRSLIGSGTIAANTPIHSFAILVG